MSQKAVGDGKLSESEEANCLSRRIIRIGELYESSNYSISLNIQYTKTVKPAAN